MKKISLALFITSILIAVFLSIKPVSADEMIAITGTVNSEFQIVTDEGRVYSIGDNQKGMELDRFSGSRVEVFGTFLTEDDELVIMVIDFNIISADNSSTAPNKLQIGKTREA